MKVILLENLIKIGSIGDIIDVKRGFARNYLISSKKALYASKENIKEVEKIKNELNKKDQGKKKDAKTIYEKINKKEYKTAIKSILTSLLKNKRLIVVDTFKIDEPKTKEMSKVLKSLEVDDALIVVNEKQTNLDLASRNIPKVELITVEKINPVSLISHENVVIDTAGIKKIESIYGWAKKLDMIR